MKTKLLKKVRKRYTILRISSYANTASPTWIQFCNKIGMPFFYLKDLDSSFGFRNSAHKEYGDALARLTAMIHADYYESKARKIPAKIEKVWYK